jgi:hypothetical protein
MCRAMYQLERDQPTQYQACVFRFEDYEARRRERLRSVTSACPRGASVSVHVGDLITTYEGTLACTPAHGGLFCMSEADGGVGSSVRDASSTPP